MIYLGTSGYSFNDWIGTVYPENIKKSQMLTYYWSRFGFNTVELNFTYYTVPSYRTMISILRKTPNDFTFSVKLPGHVTHQAWKDGKIDRKVIKSYIEAVKPIEDEKRILAHLAQFPYAFKFSKKGLKYIEQISNIFNPLAVEFRHSSWDKKEVYDFLKNNNITFVIVDEPKLEKLFPYKPIVTTDTAYFRFHGRNENWFDSDHDRYDYMYSEEELRSFAKDIKEISKRVNKILIYFNNCYKGQAVKNALKMRDLLGT